jgi:hypothetical protein
MTTQQKLFAVYLGGRAPKGNTELHDVVFVTGGAIEDTYEQLLDKWFGSPERLHLDSWVEFDIVDGHRVTLDGTAVANGKQLYFVNLGAYRENEFTEIHANTFVVAASEIEARARAKSELLKGWPSAVHTDDVYDIDSCIKIDTVNDFHIALTPVSEPGNLKPNNGYHSIPKPIIEEYIKRHAPRAAEIRRDA